MVSLYYLGYFIKASKQKEQAWSELNVAMDDVIHEQGHNVPVYTNMSIKWGWIFLVKGEEVINNEKTSKIVGFYAPQKWKKSSNGPPFGSFSREK